MDIMATKVKIKIIDNSELRAEIDYHSIDAIVDGFRVNESWQTGKARMHDVRQAGFRIHRIARECDSEIKKTALRVAGQAVASGHMREHAMVASDYAVKTIGLISSNDMDAITREREWQLNELKKFNRE